LQNLCTASVFNTPIGGDSSESHEDILFAETRMMRLIGICGRKYNHMLICFDTVLECDIWMDEIPVSVLYVSIAVLAPNFQKFLSQT